MLFVSLNMLVYIVKVITTHRTKAEAENVGLIPQVPPDQLFLVLHVNS